MNPVTAATLAAILIGMPIMAARTHRAGILVTLPRDSIYLSVVVSQWLLAAILLGVMWVEDRWFDLSGLLSQPIGAERTALFAVATLAAMVALIALTLLANRLSARSETDAIQHLVPRTADERLMMVLLVAPTAGIVEELIYRGYAISRLAPLVGGEWQAAVLTSVAFAAGHIYQGPFGLARAGALGILLAAPYVITGSLLPSMIAHILIDVGSGLVGDRLFLSSDDDETPRGDAGVDDSA